MTQPELVEGTSPANYAERHVDAASQPASEDSDDADVGEDQDIAWSHMCKDNIDAFLTKKKGFTAQQAKAFRKQHLALYTTSLNYECMDLDEVRTVKAHCTFTHTPVEGGGEVTLKGTHHYHLRRRFTIDGEYFAEASFSIEGAGCDADGSFFDCDSDRKKGVFKLKKAGAVAIQQAFGPDWSPYEAVMFVFAALGIAYHDGTVDIDSHCATTPQLKTREFESAVTSVCKDDKPKAKGGAKRKGAAAGGGGKQTKLTTA